jgi:hypothetical protein
MVKFIDTRVTAPGMLTCAICTDESDPGKKFFVVHEGTDGPRHPMHRKCVATALKYRLQCPVCRVDIAENNLVSRRDTVQHILSSSGRNLDTAERQMATPMVMGAAAIALISAIEFAGLRGAKDVLAVGGMGYACSALMFGLAYGTAGVPFTLKKVARFAMGGFVLAGLLGNELWRRDFLNPDTSRSTTAIAFAWCGAALGAIAAPFIGRGSRADAGAEDRITQTSRVAGFVGTTIGLAAWLFGKTQDSTLAQIAGIVSIARSTGLIPLGVGAGVGLATAQTIRLGEWASKNSETIIATSSAAITAAVSFIRNQTGALKIDAGIAGAATRVGFSVSRIIQKIALHNFDRVQALIGVGMVAGMAAAAGSTLLTRAYNSYQRRIETTPAPAAPSA